MISPLRRGRLAVRDGSVELFRGDDVVRRSAVPLPAPDRDGLVRVVGGLPLEEVAPGPYTLRLVLSDGRTMATRSVDVTLTP